MRATGTDGRVATFTPDRVIGQEPLRQYLVPFPGGRWQTLEAAYDPRTNEWFDVFGSEDRQPGEWGHWTGRGMTWNSMCAGCHNTRVAKNYDPRADRFDTRMAEASVGCEACHGPLKAHNDWQAAHGRSGRRDPTVTRLTRAQVLDNCGFCHARRGDLTGDFKPGDRFLDHQTLVGVSRSDLYYPDGQVRDENYEYGSFLGSRMHFRGVICTDCHNPHSGRTLLPGNWLCIRCHNGSYTNAPVIDPVAHSHHKVHGFDTSGQPTDLDLSGYDPRVLPETGGECVNCHMPQTAYMQRHWRHDHGFTIPDPLLTRQFGIPNACNRCHADKTVAWAEDACAQWYGTRMDRPTRRRAQSMARGRAGEAAARDDLLRVLSSEDIGYWRVAAMEMLAPWMHEPAVEAAVVAALDHTNALVRAAAARALDGSTAEPGSLVPAALDRALKDPVRAVRVAAAWSRRHTVDPASQAGTELRGALAVNADQPAGRMQMGAWYLARHDTNRALAEYALAVAWDGGSAPIRHDYAVVLSMVGRTPEAIAQLETACRLAPGEAEFAYKLGLAWNEAGDLGKAVANLEAAVKLDRRHAAAWHNLGLAYSAAGRDAQAVTALEQAEHAAPRDARSAYARATVLARLGRHHEAAVAAARALELEPGWRDAAVLLRSLQTE